MAVAESIITKIELIHAVVQVDEVQDFNPMVLDLFTLTLTLMLRYAIIIFGGDVMDIKYYQIDEVAKITGITKRTIRYYEDLELLKPERTEASYRLYTVEDIETIKEIKNLRLKLGMDLAQIQRFMGLKKNIKDILEGNIKEIDKIKETEDKIKELMILVDEKENILKRIKNNCINYLDRLSKTADTTEE